MSKEEGTNPSTRRGFMGAMTALTAASYNRVLGANDRVGLGFIGYGLIGKQHIANFKKSFPDVDRVALCDVYKPRLDEGLAYLDNPNAKGYGDFRKMYENKDIDGVVVATPDHWHAMLTIMACAAGKDVYVEKPLTVFIDEGKWMLQAMNKYKRVVVVGTQRNHNPGHRRPGRLSRAVRWVKSRWSAWAPVAATSFRVSASYPRRRCRPASITIYGSARRPSGPTSRIAACTIFDGSGITPAAN